MEVATNNEAKPSLPLKLRVLAWLNSTVLAASKRRNGTVNRGLYNIFDAKVPPNPKPVDGVITNDITVDPSRNLWFRVYTPTNLAGGAPVPVVVYFHGGGFIVWGANSRPCDSLCRQLAREVGAVIVSVDYRLAPEHKYPAQCEDGIDVLKFLDADGRKCLPEGSDLSSCFIAGDSAGGNLAHHVAVRACKSDFQQLKLVGLVSLQPFFGGENRTESEKRDIGACPLDQTDWWWNSFLPEGSNRDHEAANVSGPNAIDISLLENFPPTIVLMGTLDGFLDWQRRYCEWLERNGKDIRKVEYPNMVHGFFLFPDFKESGQLMFEVKDFIHNHMNNKSSSMS